MTTPFHQANVGLQLYNNNVIDYPPHIHNDIEIIVMYEGNATADINGITYILNQGEVLIVFPNSVHSYKQNTPVKVGKFIFSPDLIPQLNDKLIYTTTDPIISQKVCEINGILDLSKEILSNYNNYSINTKNAYIYLLTSKILDNITINIKDKPNNATTRILEYVNKNFCLQLNLSDVANALFFSKSYISHIFSQKLKINFCDYINCLRIDKSLNLLLSTDKNVTEISYEVGFGSIRSFNRIFISKIGMSPKKFRSVNKA